MYRATLEVVCDTSFLLEAIKRRLLTDLLERYRPVKIYIPSQVYEELSRLSARNPHARAALRMISGSPESFEVVDVDAPSADEAVLRLACGRGYVVASTDSGVRRRARRLGCKTLFIRGSWLSLE